jgi:hypothetical protein
VTGPMLEQLEAQIATLPADAIKHDMEPGFEVMAQWIQGLDGARRAEVLSEVPVWLKDTHSWHSRAVMEIALRLRDRQLLEAAVREAKKRGVHDLAGGDEYPSWLSYNLSLISTISLWPGDPGPEVRAYLSDLRAGVSAASYSRRLLAIRACFTECLLGLTMPRKRCLSEGLAELRKWRDPRLLRSGLSLLHAYFASTPEGVADLKEVLTSEEFAMACPELVAS